MYISSMLEFSAQKKVQSTKSTSVKGPRTKSGVTQKSSKVKRGGNKNKSPSITYDSKTVQQDTFKAPVEVDLEQIEPVEQTAPDGKKVMAYPAYYLILLWLTGMKIVPTYKNSRAFNYDGLCAEEELAQCPGPLKNAMRVIYLNLNFWTIERITKEAWRFEGIRCIPGKTYIRDKQGNKIGNPRRLFILDIDSEDAYRHYKNLLEKEWIPYTYVSKTYDEFGYHVYWLEDWADDNDIVTIDYKDCKNLDYFRVEFMVGLAYAQVAGKHRDHLDSTFFYHNVGCKIIGRIELAYRPGQYNQLLEISNNVLELDQIKERRKLQKKNKDPFLFSGQSGVRLVMFQLRPYPLL